MAVSIYVRVSTEEQRERQSIATQREFASRYCDLHELQVYETYADDGVSGTVPVEQRPGMIQLLRDAKLGRFDQLLIYKLDRLGREARLILNAVAEFEKAGVRVRSMTEEFDTATATGRLMLTMLSGFAAHEREVIRERSVAGTNRLAATGAWLGGVVPYGYRKEGERGQGRLVISEEPIAGFTQSEAEVVRLMFRMSATEKKSCRKIADHLTGLGIPCSSAASTVGTQSGKRNRTVASIWRSSHVRNLLASRTYMGEHRFGKRSRNQNRKVIVRAVPAIVSEQVWEAAQQVLRSNQIMCTRNNRPPYLLRGLIKCGLCGLTFSGIRMTLPQTDHYYRCNGRQFARGLYGNSGKKCSAKALNGDYVDRLIWADIKSFLRNPGEILELLRQRVTLQDGERQRREAERSNLMERQQQKTAERDRILALFRRGRIDEATLDQQLDLIDVEAAALHAEIETASRALSAADRSAQFRSAEDLLQTLRERLAGPIAPELKRRIVEILVEKVEANTVERWGVAQSEVVITYRFGPAREPAALVLPRAHRLSTRNQVPEALNTIGDHLRRRRLMLKPLQSQVAERLGADKASVHNWETNRTKPGIRFLPAIIRFLGYNPLPPTDRISERLVQCRTALGISQKETAQRMGVDQSTLARWERGEREPAGAVGERAIRFLLVAEATFAPVEARTA